MLNCVCSVHTQRYLFCTCKLFVLHELLFAMISSQECIYLHFFAVQKLSDDHDLRVKWFYEVIITYFFSLAELEHTHKIFLLAM